MDDEAHVICCNDAIEGVVTGSIETAEAILSIARARHKILLEQAGVFDHLDRYKTIYYWHIHTVRAYTSADLEKMRFFLD